MSATTSPRPTKTKPKSPLDMILAFFGSYGLCCVILVFLFILTFLGTIEQGERGLYEVQKLYFESLFLIHWLFNKVPVPLPGGLLLMSLLAINLIVGGLVRIRKNRGTLGVIVVHVGMGVLMLAGLVKLMRSDDGHLTLYEEGKVDRTMSRSDEFQSYHLWEVVIFDAAQTSNVTEYIIPHEQFIELGTSVRTFRSKALPFTLKLHDVMKNSEVRQPGMTWQAQLPVIDGYALRGLPSAKENEANVPGVYVTIEDPAGTTTEGLLHGFARYPLSFRAGGKLWGIDLRKKRYKMPFTIVLKKFTRELYPRTSMPKVFKSDVLKIEGGIEEDMRIEMNAPLRQGGFTLFQSSWGPANAPPGTPLFSTFSVVRNPSDHWPLYACIVITIGMLMAFAQKLIKYTRSQAKKREQEATK